jgi:hypothetical protein
VTSIDGAAILDRLAAWIGPHLALPSEHCLPAIVLWAAHTHAADAFYVTPRLVLSSPEPGSGKTRVLELLNLVCRKPELVLSPTTAAIFRMLADGPITLLFDEIDAVFNPKSGGNNEDLRGLLNSGYKRGATIPRCVGDAAKMAVQRFVVYAPTALAGLAGHMPATIVTRAVVIHMRKRPTHLKVRPFRERDAETESRPIREEVARWIETLRPSIGDARPVMPEGVEDRPAEVWEALLAIADAAGGHWPATARAACEHFVLHSGGQAQSLGVRLLRDLRTVFAGADRMATADILTELMALPESPWSDLGGKPLDAVRLAKALKPYEISATVFRTPDGSVRGYTTYAVGTRDTISAGLDDAWSRYLPPERAPSDADTAEGATDCLGCGQALALITPGRELCAGCETEAVNDTPAPAGRQT